MQGVRGGCPAGRSAELVLKDGEGLACRRAEQQRLAVGWDKHGEAGAESHGDTETTNQGRSS